MSMTGSWLWYDSIRVLTIRDVLGGRSFSPGSRILEGTITGVSRFSTTYGPIVVLGLDGDPTCFAGSVFGDPAVEYQTGSRFRTVLHFETFVVDGTSGVWAPELACPFLWNKVSASSDADDESSDRGRVLRPVEMSADGWMSYRVDQTWPPETNVYEVGELFALLGERTTSPTESAVDSAPEWRSFWGREMSALGLFFPIVGSGNACWGPEIDRLRPLSDDTSLYNRIRFVDANANDVVDEDDVFQVRLDPVEGNTYQTYFLEFGPAEGYYIGGKYILHGPHGPYEWVHRL